MQLGLVEIEPLTSMIPSASGTYSSSAGPLTWDLQHKKQKLHEVFSTTANELPKKKKKKK
jgi:hypothetical protein